MYIRSIRIKNLWGKDFLWHLQKDVNVLVGKNGFGKSTIFKMVNEALSPISNIDLNFRLFDPIDEMIIELQNGIVIQADSEQRILTGLDLDKNYEINVSFIDTFDVVAKHTEPNGTLLDYKIEQLKQDFIKYQRDLSVW